MQDKELDHICGILERQNQRDSSGSNGVTKVVAIVLGVSALLALVHSQISPLSQRISAQKAQMREVEQRGDDKFIALDDKLQIEVGRVEDKGTLEADRTKARLEKLERWQTWWYQRKVGDNGSRPTKTSP